MLEKLKKTIESLLVSLYNRQSNGETECRLFRQALELAQTLNPDNPTVFFDLVEISGWALQAADRGDWLEVKILAGLIDRKYISGRFNNV